MAFGSPSWKVTVSLPRFLAQDRIHIEQGTLNITVVNLSDAGMYQCVAENKHGVIFSNAELGVLGESSHLRGERQQPITEWTWDT